MSSFLDAFDVDQEKLELIDAAVRQPPRRNDRRICICGHSVSRHDLTDRNKCKPGRFECECKRLHPVIEVPNTRFFMSRTMGSGEKHALTRGIFLARQGMGEDFDSRATWLVDLVCENPSCGKPTKLYPVMCERSGYRIYDTNPATGKCNDEGITSFLCEECRVVYYDSDIAIATKRDALRSQNN